MSGYIQPDYSSVKMLAESRLYQFEAGDLTFNFVDKDTDKSHRYWSDRIAQSTSYTYNSKTFDWPMVKVYDPADTAHPLYVGFIDKRYTVWDGQVISSFRAMSALAYLDTIDAEPLRNTETALGQYSGYAETLAAKLLRKGGFDCPAGDTWEVDIKDMQLGTTQDKVHWNHSSRSWLSNIGNDPITGKQLGDLIPAKIAGHPEIRGFVVYQGKVHKVVLNERSEIELTDMTATLQALFPAANEATLCEYLSGATYRLLSIRRRDNSDVDRDCLYIVTSKASSSYTQSKTNWNGYSWLDPSVRLASMPVALIPGVGPAVSVGMNLGITAAEAVTERTVYTSNGDAVWAMGPSCVVSVDDDGGLGANFSQGIKYSGSSAKNQYYPADHQATSNDCDLNNVGEIWMTFFNGTNAFTVTRRWWQNDGTIISSDLASFDVATYGMPAGGMAAIHHVVMVGTTKGCIILTQKLNGAWKSELVDEDPTATPGLSFSVDRPPSRQIGAFSPTTNSGNTRYACFVYGNGTSFVIRQKYMSGGARIADPPHIELDGLCDGMGHEIRGEVRVYNVGSYRQTMTLDGYDYDVAGVIFSKANDDGEELTYASTIIRQQNGAHGYRLQLLAADDLTDDQPICYPLPGGGGADWQPPSIFWDADEVPGVTVRRMIVFGKRQGRYHTIWDVYVSSLVMVARIHWDFLIDKVSIRQALEGICRSFYCWNRIYNPVKSASPSEVKIVSRHSYTPGDAGDLTRAEVERGPQVQGIEWYDGVRATVEGENIEAGTTTIGRQVFNLNGLFLTNGWAQGIADRVVAAYPSKSTVNPAYPNGRRIFVVNCRRISSGGADVMPGYADLYKTVDLSIFTDAGFTGVKGLILSIGYSRQTATYQLTLIEWDDFDVDWSADGAASTSTDMDFVTGTATAAPATMPGPHTLSLGWNQAPHCCLAAAQSNPNDYPCAYAWKVNTGPGMYFRWYRYGLRETGDSSHAAIWMSLWTDSGGTDSHPEVEIPQCRALIIHDGRSIGPVWIPLNVYLADTSESATSDTTGTGLRDAYLDGYWLPPNTDIWVMAVQDGVYSGSIVAPIDWWDGGIVGMGTARRWSFLADTSEAPTLGDWVDIWDDADAVRQQYVPAITLEGEI